MAKTIQIRRVPDAVHDALKARAAAGMSLSAYLRKELATLAERPTLAETLERLEKLPRVDLPVSSADLIREQRGPI